MQYFRSGVRQVVLNTIINDLKEKSEKNMITKFRGY